MPGPIAATCACESARASRPASVHRLEEKPRAVRARHADERVGVKRLDRRAHLVRVDRRLDPDRGQLDHLGAERLERPRHAARLRARARDDDPLAVERPPLEPRDVLAPRRNRAEDEDRRRAQALALDLGGQRLERRHRHPLAGQRAALDRGRGLGRIAPRLDQAAGDVGQVLDAHVEDERAREARERLPVERRLGLLRILVAGDERDRRGVVAVGHGNAGVRGGGDARR